MDAVVKKDHTCSVCLELFSEPKVLPCCHTFCLKCLEKTARSGQEKGEIACPQCRKTHAIPAGGLTEFLTDFIVSYEIEVKKFKTAPNADQNATSTDTVGVCSECEERVPIESYCCDCQHYLCHDCIQIHKKFKSFRGHTAVPIEDLNTDILQSSQTQYCTKHTKEPLKLFCDTCQMIVCCNCIVVDHHQHKYMFAEDARKN